MRGSFFFLRTWCAAMPIPTKSSERNISSASCWLIPIKLSANLGRRTNSSRVARLDAGVAGRRGQLERPEARDQPRFGAPPEVEVEPFTILRIERKVDVFTEIALERPGRQVELERRALSNLCDARHAIFLRGQKAGDHLGGYRFAAPHPEGQHARPAGHLAPLVRHVIEE